MFRKSVGAQIAGECLSRLALHILELFGREPGMEVGEDIADAIKNREINLIINTPLGRMGAYDDSYIRMLAIQYKIPYVTTMSAARATVDGISSVLKNQGEPKSLQDYHSMYIDLYNEFRKGAEEEKENINDDLVFEMELIKQIEINIDYVLALIKIYHEDHTKNRELLLDINKAIDSSVELRNKKDLINQFITSLDVHAVVDEDWQKFVDQKKIEELEQIISNENLDRDATYKFVKNAFRDGSVPIAGTSISKVLPPVSRFTPTGDRTKKRESVLSKLTNFFERFFDISGGNFPEQK